MKNILDKPIKAKTLKKKLEKTLSLGGSFIVGHRFNPKTKEIETIYDDKPLQNNKPSIELIEKLDLMPYLTDKKLDAMNYLIISMTAIKHKQDEIIEKLNEHSVRLGEEEDDED